MYHSGVIFQMLLNHVESSLSVTAKRYAEENANVERMTCCAKSCVLVLDSVQIIINILNRSSVLFLLISVHMLLYFEVISVNFIDVVNVLTIWVLTGVIYITYGMWIYSFIVTKLVFSLNVFFSSKLLVLFFIIQLYTQNDTGQEIFCQIV